jgi:hypothetical protein
LAQRYTASRMDCHRPREVKRAIDGRFFLARITAREAGGGRAVRTQISRGGALSVAAAPHLSPAVAAHALHRESLALDNWGPYAGIGVLPCHPLLLAVGVTARQDAGDEGEENNVSHGWVSGAGALARWHWYDRAIWKVVPVPDARGEYSAVTPRPAIRFPDTKLCSHYQREPGSDNE